MQPGKADIGLELHAGGTQNPGPGGRRCIRGGIKQHRLAHARFAQQQQHAAPDSGLGDKRPD
jgi:hypothetical protein